MSRGSTPLPSDLLIFRPSPSWIMAWMKTSRNGSRPGSNSPLSLCPFVPSSLPKYRLNITMRDTHNVMISRAVQRTEVGLKASSSPIDSGNFAGSGQPMVESGQRAEENQVSSTSGSCSTPRSMRSSISIASCLANSKPGGALVAVPVDGWLQSKCAIQSQNARQASSAGPAVVVIWRFRSAILSA